MGFPHDRWSTMGEDRSSTLVAGLVAGSCLAQSSKAPTAFLAEKKAPAAALKTTTELIHVIKSWKRHFSEKKSACGSLEDHNRAKTCHKILETSFF